jgi:hypothetical protein
MYQDCKKCCQCNICCPLVIIGPGVYPRDKEAEERRRIEWIEEMESHMKDLFESLKRDHPEIFEKVVEHKQRYNIVEETISKEYDESGEL